MSAPRISIVIPIYNEEPLLHAAAVDLHERLLPLGWSYEVLLAENGSRDGTVAVAHELCSRYPEFRTFSVGEPNYGLALRMGILRSRGELVICDEIDLCDTTFHRAAVALLDAGEAEFVIGSKLLSESRDERPLSRHVASQLYNGLLRVMLGFRGTDTHGLKAFRRSVVEPIARRCLVDRDVFASELVIRADRAGVTIREIPVRVLEKRPPSIDLTRRVPAVLRQLARLTWAIRLEAPPPRLAMFPRRPPAQRAVWLLIALWSSLLAVDLKLRTEVSNNADPAHWRLVDVGIYSLGALWSLASWALIAALLAWPLGPRPRLRRALTALLALGFGSAIMASFGYRLYYYQSPSWQVVKFAVAEPVNTWRIFTWTLGPGHLAAFLVFTALIALALDRSSRWAPSSPPRMPRWLLLLLGAFYLTNSALTLLVAGFQDPLPVEANSAAAVAQFVLATTTRERHLVAPVRPTIPPQPPRPRPSVLLIIHESLRADAVFADLGYGDVPVDARALSPFSVRIPERKAEGFYPMPRARSNASATEVSLPTILSGIDPGGDTDAYGRVHTVWSLGKASGAKTWLFSAQTYAWSHFDEYFFDRNLDLAQTGLDLAPAYVNDIGVDDQIPVDRALEHIASLRRSGERWVGVVHFSGTHVPGYPGPGIPPEPSEPQRWRQAARYIDLMVERLLTGLEASGAADDTLIVSTSDHGEPLESTRKVRRLGSYYEGVVRVPLWVRVPPRWAAEHPEWLSSLEAWQPRNVQNLSILPTIRDALVLDDSPELSRHLPGASLLRPPGNRPDIASGQGTCAFRAWWQEGLYIVNGSSKLLLSNERSSPELYDLASDPSEQRNLWSDPASREAALSWARPYLLSGVERAAACKRIGQNCVLP